MTRDSCRRRTGRVVPRAEKCWWFNNRGSQSSQWRMWIATQSSIRCWRKGHLRYCCNQVWINNGGRIPWNVTAICECETFRIFCLMGGHHMKGGSENHLTDQLYRLEQWSNITLFCERPSRLHQFGPEVLPGFFLGYVLFAGRIRKGDIMVADIEELEQMDASELYARRLNAEEVSTPMKGENFIFPVADGTVKISGGDQDLRTSTLIRDSPDTGEEQDILRGESEGSSSIPRQDVSWYDGEANSDFWSISGDFIYRHRVEPQVKLFVPTEGSYIDWCRRNILKITGMLMEKENCRMHGPGCTRFILLNEKPPDGYTWSGRRLTRKQTTSRPDNVGPDMWKHVSDESKKKRKEKQKWTIEKPTLDNARRLRGTYLIDPDDQEFKDIMKNARGKLEVPMPASMPCQIQLESFWATCSVGKDCKTKYACMVEADESLRIRMEGAPHRYHEDHIAGKGMNSLSHYNIVHMVLFAQCCVLRSSVHSRAQSPRVLMCHCTCPATRLKCFPVTSKSRLSRLCLARVNTASSFGTSLLLLLGCSEVAGKLAALLEDARQNTLVWLKLTNLWEFVWKELLTDIMKIILQEKERIYWVTAILCTWCSVHNAACSGPACTAERALLVSSCVIVHQMQRQQWENNGITRENTGMAADESQEQKWGDRWSKEWGQKSSFCVIHGSLSSQEFGVGTTSSELQRSSRTSRRHCERWFRILCSIYWASIISITDDSCKSNGCHTKAARWRRTSSRRNIVWHPG